MRFVEARIRVPEQPFLDYSEVAALLKIHPKTLQRWVREGNFPPPRRKGVWSAMSVGVWMAYQEYTGSAEIGDEQDEEVDHEKTVKTK